MHRIIDFRVRPPFKSFSKLTIFGARLDAPNRPAAWVGDPAQSVRSRSMDAFVAELSAANVAHAVVWGRAVPDVTASTATEDIAELVQTHSGLFSGFGGIAVPRSVEQVDACVHEVERALIKFKLKGITLEPGFAMSATEGADDAKLFPVYERCQELGGILALTISVRAGSDLSYSNPEAVDRVAAKFPKLRIVVGHSFWPWVAQACGVAYRRSNVYLLPDFYGLACPGHMQWVEAANSLLSGQIIFGSAYPLAAVEPMVRGYQALPFRAEVMEKVMWRNAAALLGIAD